ncbi:MAG: hypothetical protein ACRC4M_04710 [Mycoplasma sp.]
MIKINNEEINFTTYPNGETVFLEYGNEEENHIEFFYDGNDADITKLLLLGSYLKGKSKKVVCTFTYLPYSRMDREVGDKPFILKELSKLINSIGFDQVNVIDPHSKVSIDLLNNSKEIRMESMIKELIEKIKPSVIVFPDSGCHNKYIDLAKELSHKHIIIVGLKSRDKITGRISDFAIKQQVSSTKILTDIVNTLPSNALIIDDICSYGGTFLNVIKELKEYHCNNVSLFVTHCEDNIFKGNLLKEEGLEKVFTTKSTLKEIPEEYKDKVILIENIDNIKKLSLNKTLKNNSKKVVVE